MASTRNMPVRDLARGWWYDLAVGLLIGLLLMAVWMVATW